MILKSFAKINLGLEIKNKRTDNFHDLNMIMQSINFFDLIKISKINSNKILVICNKNICEIKKNLAYKAAKIIFDLIKPDFGIKIKIKKKSQWEPVLVEEVLMLQPLFLDLIKF